MPGGSEPVLKASFNAQGQMLLPSHHQMAVCWLRCNDVLAHAGNPEEVLQDPLCDVNSSVTHSEQASIRACEQMLVPVHYVM